MIDLTEFLLSMLKLYSGSLEHKEKFIFDMYDFDKDGAISREDVRTLLLSLPIQKKTNSSRRKFSADVEIEREESVEQLDKFIEGCFGANKLLDFNAFKTICKTESSELFLGLYLTIKKNLPNSSQFEKYQKLKDLSVEEKKIVQEKFATPKILTKFLPISTIIKKSSPQGKAKTNTTLDKYFNDLLILNPNNPIQSTLTQDANAVRFPNQIKGKEQILMSPSDIIMEAESEKESIFCKCGRNIKDELETKCEVCRNIDKIGIIEGEPFKLSRTGKYIKSRYILDKHELVHKSVKKTNKYCSRVLTSCFIQEELDEFLDNIPFFAFKIIWTDKTIKLGFYAKDEYNKWINALKTIIGYSNIFDFYKIDDKIGSGKFSTVYKGKHLKTSETVAVKIITKHSMKPIDVENVFREIEILKLCQHPNIIRLYDVFVNAEYIYIVQEYLPGGDLFKFLEKVNFSIEMSLAHRFIEEISRALDYMHSFGIVHRDLKPENILLTDMSGIPQLKIVDFGLSKMIGPKEKCTEPFGTLGYVAPEIIQRKEYTQNVDIWSLGIITHLLVLGNLPFFDVSEKEVAK